MVSWSCGEVWRELSKFSEYSVTIQINFRLFADIIFITYLVTKPILDLFIQYIIILKYGKYHYIPEKLFCVFLSFTWKEFYI